MTHPACLQLDDLLSQCIQKAARRSGPGGQHRNKVETAIILTHQPTGIQAEANERRSQAENRTVALHRLRLKLALESRTTVEGETSVSDLWRTRCQKGKILISVEHADYPCLLAELLDFLVQAKFDMSQAAEHFEASASQLTKLVRKYPAALQQLNAHRSDLGLNKLS